jgi:hypothetical protein
MSDNTFPAPSLGKAPVRPRAQLLRVTSPHGRASERPRAKRPRVWSPLPKGSGATVWPMKLSSRCPALEGSGGDTCLVASCVPNTIDKGATYAR